MWRYKDVKMTFKTGTTGKQSKLKLRNSAENIPHLLTHSTRKTYKILLHNYTTYKTTNDTLAGYARFSLFDWNNKKRKLKPILLRSFLGLTNNYIYTSTWQNNRIITASFWYSNSRILNNWNCKTKTLAGKTEIRLQLLTAVIFLHFYTEKWHF